MKERPIIFSSEMVLALLDGRKTMTRRVIKHVKPIIKVWGGKGDDDKPWVIDHDHVACPYGKVGDRLWVRESFKVWGNTIIYKADWVKKDQKGWKPSIHMPRKASRITLEITNIRVERLGDISEEDAKAEGVQPEKIGLMTSKEYNCPRFCYRKGFEKLWEKIHGIECDFDFESSKWVWAIEFRKL